METKIIAQLSDADINLTLEQRGAKYHITATRATGVSPAVEVLRKTADSLGEAIKEITIFYVSEWESVFVMNRLSEKMEQAISAS